MGLFEIVTIIIMTTQMIVLFALVLGQDDIKHTVEEMHLGNYADKTWAVVSKDELKPFREANKQEAVPETDFGITYKEDEKNPEWDKDEAYGQEEEE